MRELPMPELTAGHVRIKVSAFGLNYADVMSRQGIYRECPPLPCVIGYDVEGVIDAVASDVSNFKPGDRVFALTRFGGYAQYVTTAIEGVGSLPEGAKTGEGCALATQYVTAVHAAIHCQTLMPGEKVLIHAAAGGLGTALIQIALWKGCIVIGVAGGAEKMEYLKSLGVQHPVDHKKVDYMNYINTHFDGRVDVIFDNVGGSSFKNGKSILARGGRIVTLGAASLSGKGGKLSLVRLGIGFGFFSPISYLTKSQNLIGVNMLKIADHRPDIIAHVFEQTQELYKAGVLKPHVGKIFEHTHIAEAHAFMEDRKSIGKIVVRWY
ncbi:MAG: zinc-binding dehydrogenase [Bacteroidota bacterium]|nr:zinc-binding dehydrogenase [Bacteroidota bacterium]